MKPAAPGTTVRERKNWLIHMLYVRQDYDRCLTIIEEALKECKGNAECAPLHVHRSCGRERRELPSRRSPAEVGAFWTAAV